MMKMKRVNSNQEVKEGYEEEKEEEEEEEEKDSDEGRHIKKEGVKSEVSFLSFLLLLLLLQIRYV